MIIFLFMYEFPFGKHPTYNESNYQDIYRERQGHHTHQKMSCTAKYWLKIGCCYESNATAIDNKVRDSPNVTVISDFRHGYYSIIT